MDTFDQALQRIRSSGQVTIDALFGEMYEAIRREARRQMAGERRGITLQATELVGEAYLRLRNSGSIDWQDRHHFIGTVAQIMRRVLVDEARRRCAQKRGGGAHPVSLVTLGGNTQMPIDELIALEDALQKLASEGGNLPREARVLELVFFAGATRGEVASALKITERQVYRDYAHARVWLRREIGI